MHYTLCDLIADLTQNATEAGSTIIKVDFLETPEKLTVIIQDNGKGMNADTLKRVKDPFYTDGIKHPNRKVGLGIPFLMQTAMSTNGDWDIKSEEGIGTAVSMSFDLSNIDTPPIGNIQGLFRQILILPGDYELIITRKKQSDKGTLDYTLAKTELLDILGGLETISDLALLGDFLESQEEYE